VFISDYLRRENNNIDIIRLILSSMVIWGHTLALNGNSTYWIDPITYLFPFTYSGAVAVKIFFFISGLVVTNSLLKNGSPVQFIVSRFFRIWPSLLFCALITSLVIGPFLSSYASNYYFAGLDNFRYIRNGFFLAGDTLPGVFTNNYRPSIVNGSLWTLPLEVNCYIILLALFV
jgi:peptidoglycan/LPS O-acetylase OafA/YrhL